MLRISRNLTVRGRSMDHRPGRLSRNVEVLPVLIFRRWCERSKVAYPGLVPAIRVLEPVQCLRLLADEPVELLLQFLRGAHPLRKALAEFLQLFAGDIEVAHFLGRL